jgi:DMSO/TMAO reductase YedYZ heme-binding membrane subunit
MYNQNLEVLGLIAILVIVLFIFVCYMAHVRGRSIIGTLILSITMTPFIALGLVLLIGPDYVALAKRAKED